MEDERFELIGIIKDSHKMKKKHDRQRYPARHIAGEFCVNFSLSVVLYLVKDNCDGDDAVLPPTFSSTCQHTREHFLSPAPEVVRYPFPQMGGWDLGRPWLDIVI